MAEREQSEFNDSLGYLNRLNGLFYICDNSAMNLQANEWFHALLSLSRELSTEMNDTDQEKSTTYQEAIRHKLPKFAKDLTRGVQQISPDLYEQLHNFELFLRKITKDSGLQQKMKERPGDALT